MHILYKYPNTTNWFNVDAISPRNSPTEINMKHIIKKTEEYEILIYGPLLCEVTKLKIETPKKSKIDYIKTKKYTSIMIMGGIHSFGVGCTACGVMFSNIIGRKFDSEINNISFNEINYLKNTYEYLKKNKIPKTTLTILELDYIKQDEEIYNEYIEKVITQAKSKSNILIGWYSIPKTEKNKHQKLKKLEEKYLYDEKIQILDLSFIYGEKYSEMCTHSRNFINDAGNIMIYKKIKECIEKISEFTKNGD